MRNRNIKPRNLLHNHPMLRKGGVHEKSNKAKRRSDKQALRKAWFFPSMWFNRVLGKGLVGQSTPKPNRRGTHQVARLDLAPDPRQPASQDDHAITVARKLFDCLA